MIFSKHCASAQYSSSIYCSLVNYRLPSQACSTKPLHSQIMRGFHSVPFYAVVHACSNAVMLLKWRHVFELYIYSFTLPPPTDTSKLPSFCWHITSLSTVSTTTRGNRSTALLAGDRSVNYSTAHSLGVVIRWTAFLVGCSDELLRYIFFNSSL